MSASGPRIPRATAPTRRTLWRSSDDRLGDLRTSDLRALEFAPGADAAPDALARREFLRLAGAGAALASVSACGRAQKEKLHPYVVEPSQAVPGNPLFFATAMTTDGYATGLVVESHEGRPTKIEGNAEHPASQGGTSARHQAAILSLYDPDRAREVTHVGTPSAWGTLREAIAAAGRAAGRRVALVLPATGSPSVIDQVARLRARSPRIDVRWHAPLAPTAAWHGARLAYGEVLETQLDLRSADVVLALDSDFLVDGPSSLRLAREFASRRKLESGARAMNRLYAVEPALTVTGMSADHRLRVRAADVFAVAAAIVAALANAGVELPADLVAALTARGSRAQSHGPWARAVAQDLATHRRRCAVLVGRGQPPELHALAHLLNAALENVGSTVAYTRSVIADAGTPAFDLAPLARDLEAGSIDTLLVCGGNPVYGAAAELDLARRFGSARESVYLGAYVDETARACQWFAPLAHFLESWGDARAVDGTVSLVQPLTPPMCGGHTTSDVLAALLGEPEWSSRESLLAYWRRARSDTDATWDSWLERGVLPGSASPVVARPSIRHEAIREAVVRMPLAQPTLELAFRADPRVHDGADTNNAWLLELPDPVTRQTWGNAALVSPTTASRLGLTDGDVVRLELGGRSALAPVLVAPGHADETFGLALGYGRSGDGERTGRGVGTNAGSLRTLAGLWFESGLRVVKTGVREELALEQLHSSLEGRDDSILLHRTLDEYRQDPRFTRASDERPLALYEPARGGGRQWGMVIDLNACTGCAACVVACQAENNIPVVGRAGVTKGRAMHWMRIDRYFVGPPEDPRPLLEPMLCQHCEKAPCEYVCPVNATTHSSDGLNQMTYNRCVGTRFCSNNCPYKVRRFNWFDYHSEDGPGLSGAHNPEVTVRARGVMEKCTYCVQRIRGAEIRAAVERRPLADGDVQTACEAACPSRAITFGDVADPASRVSVLRKDERRFAVLDEVGTVPRTRYLARITNPNPELA